MRFHGSKELKNADTAGEWGTTRPAANTHRRLFKLAGRIPFLFAGSALLSFFSASVIIAQMYLLSVVISGVFRGDGDTQNLRYHLLFLLITIVLRAAISWLHEIHAQYGAVRVKSDLRERLVSRLIVLGPAYTKKEKTGELTSTAVEGIEKLDDYYAKYIPSAVAVLVIPVIITLFVLYMDFLSGLVFVITGPLIPFLMWLIGTYAVRVTRLQWKAMSRMSAHFLDTLQGLKTLKLFGRSKDEADEVERTSENFRSVTMKVLQVAFLSGMVLELAASISIAIIAVEVGIRLIEGMIPFQLGLLILLLAPEFYLPFRTLGANHHAGMEGSAVAERIFDILDHTDSAGEMQNAAIKATYTVNPAAAHDKILKHSAYEDHAPFIHFENVSYTYPGAVSPALDGITCEIPAESLTAVAGRSGGGKTTFIYLLLRFLEKSSGRITVDDIALDSIDARSWRSRVAYVPQNPHLFNGTIRDNLLFANPAATEDEVIRAAKEAEAHEFIRGFPEGYETVLTENAARLSGGERQRLAIARAFLKNAPVIVMDEPTSNLDPESEEKITQAAGRLVRRKTAVVIAHRLNTVYRADQILVIENSRLAERGTHTELIRRNGLYAEFVGASR